MSHWTIDQSINLTIDWHYTMVWFPALLFKTRRRLSTSLDNDAGKVHLWKEMLCNKGENEPCFGNFELQ